MSLLLRTAARSDVGLIRPGNEDSGYAGPDLLVVADGMGGHAAGELASATAVATMAELETEGLDDEDAVARLADSVELTSERIADIITAQPELAGMGTTVTALAWLDDPPRIAIVHVGDSRAYLLRDSELTQISRDHTYVQQLVDAGRITPEEAAYHPRRNLLLRTIDGMHPAEPDLTVREARLGDRYLVCSDGLSGVVDHDDLARLLAVEDPTAAVSALVDAALEAGAPDNVTCVVADVVEADPDPRAVGRPVVVGAAGEPRVRERLPSVSFPSDAQPDNEHGPGPLVRVNTAPDTHTEGPAALARVYAEEQPARRRHGWRWLIGTVITVSVLALATILGVLWTRDQWFVGDAGGYVAVYQGVDGSLGPVSLNRVATVSPVRVDELPSFEADQVRQSIWVDSQAAADATVTRLAASAQKCVDQPTTPGCPGAAS